MPFTLCTTRDDLSLSILRLHTRWRIRRSDYREDARTCGELWIGFNFSHSLGVAFQFSQGRFCTACGAWNGCYGFELTIQLYVEHTIEIMREIRRVLRDDGLLFWNIGDTLRDKGLSAVTHRIAIAAIDDGWILRDTIIWAKPNPMPESVKDRLTRSHETILMLAKNSRYYWDTEASREAATSKDAGADGKRNMRNVWTIATQPFRGAHFAPFSEEIPRRCSSLASKPGDVVLDAFGGSGTTVGERNCESGRG